MARRSTRRTRARKTGAAPPVERDERPPVAEEPPVAEIAAEQDVPEPKHKGHRHRSRRVGEPLTLRQVAFYLGVGLLVAFVVLQVLQRVDRSRTQAPGQIEAE